MTIRGWIAVPAIVFSLLALPCGATRAAGAVPDEATIREKIATAIGPRPAAFRETDETIGADGTKTIEHDFRSGKNYRYVYDTGPFHSEEGEYAGDAWHMNDNGQVVIDQPDPGQAVPEKLTATVTAISAPVAGFLIARLNARGFGSKEYVDGAAWQIVRRERTTPNGTIATTYDDIRADHGRVFAHHVHVDNGYARTTSDLRIVEYTPDVVSDDQVKIPPPRRALVTFPAAGGPIDLPVKFRENQAIVRVTIRGRGLDFVLDSGADGITIDSSVARELGLTEYAKRSAVTAGRYTTSRTIVPEMRIGALTMRDVAIQTVPHGWNVSNDVKAVGLLGFDFLAELGVTLDYQNERVTVVPSSAYTPPADRHTIPLDVRIGDGSPYATVALNGAVGERWVLDTGGAGTFMIFDYFARRHPEALRDEGGGGGDRAMEFVGIGGDIRTRPYQIRSLRIANLNFNGFVGYRVTDASAYAESDDGIIGIEFLRMFTIGFDYSSSRVYLVPNDIGRRAMGIK